ncbi:hypothetical protein BH09PLA1_BH09PLA1_22560 [soil metagenome]
MMLKGLLIAAFALIATGSAGAQVARPRPTTRPVNGPSAASLATGYSGPLKFNPRVLSQERAAATDPNPITRAASWRYRYSSPFNNCWGYSGYSGYRPYYFGRGFYGFSGGATGVGMWGPY